ncbi:TetR/AcrR family transcriptional regulator [Rhizobium sp. YIM 134829]|uniref:TetR/AcrR family transcriptional regulator n=1 Tax=Rhizobium sp. YIM 134829 TaxID=3390453 RepID=UPI00397A62F0
MKVAREEIVTAARELFREKGYAGASMQDLAERVGLKKASLYMRFANKEALVPAVMDLLLEDTLAQGRNDTADWISAYRALIMSIADSLTDRKRCVALHLAYGVGDETPLAKQAVRSFFQALQDEMIAILMRALPREAAATLATDALTRLEGATVMIAVFDDPTAMQRAVGDSLESATRAAAA